MKTYGKELILDLHGCDSQRFTRKNIRKYFKEVCFLIDMKRGKLTWWDDVGVNEKEKQTLPSTKGTSAVQFIITSNITMHTLDLLDRVYLNLFSCKDFDEKTVKQFTAKFFRGRIVKSLLVNRI